MFRVGPKTYVESGNLKHTYIFFWPYHQIPSLSVQCLQANVTSVGIWYMVHSDVLNINLVILKQNYGLQRCMVSY